MRRTIAAFILGAVLFGAPLTFAAPPHVHTLAQVLAAGNTATLPIVGGPDLELYGANTVDGNAGDVNIAGGRATGEGVPGNVDIVGGFGNGTGSPAEIRVSPPDGGYGGNLELFSGNGYGGPAGNIVLHPQEGGTTPGLVVITYLPTSDPHVPGALWSDNGTVKVSAG